MALFHSLSASRAPQFILGTHLVREAVDLSESYVQDSVGELSDVWFVCLGARLLEACFTSSTLNLNSFLVGCRMTYNRAEVTAPGRLRRYSETEQQLIFLRREKGADNNTVYNCTRHAGRSHLAGGGGSSSTMCLCRMYSLVQR